jgi:hypothetical protein
MLSQPYRLYVIDELGSTQKKAVLAYLKVLSQHFRAGTEENDGKPPARTASLLAEI